MMPIKDGYSLVKDIKANQFTSHIPCIMLTAKSTDDSRIEGRRIGADAYLTKPFIPNELEYTVKNLIELKSSYPFETSKDKKQELYEDEFIKSLQELIDQELSNAELNVELITKHMHVSRTQLYRKVKAISGKSINQFVRDYRLIKAKELLLSEAKSVSEICFMVGFTHPSYFSARFKEYFGESPSDIS